MKVYASKDYVNDALIESMEENKITLLEALKVTTTEIKEYVDQKPTVSYEESQALGAASRTIAKNNVGVYVGTDEPTDALDGDIWIDTDDNESADSGSSLPDFTEDDNGKFLRLVDGVAVWASIDDVYGDAEELSF